MGYLFEPPVRRNKNAWLVAKTLGENGLIYSKVSAVDFIHTFITDHNKLSAKAVLKNIQRYKKRITAT